MRVIQFDERSDPHIALTDSKIRAAKSFAKSYKLTDAQDMYLLVSTSGSRLWYFHYSFGGKESPLPFDVYPLVMMANAQSKAAGLMPSR